MSQWIAFIVVSTTPNPITLAWPDPDDKSCPSIEVDVKDADPPDAAFNMHMRRGAARIGKMTGVETNTLVNVPTTAVIAFPTEELCLAAAATLRTQPGVASVSCLQISGMSGAP